jgi:hypothetical protein
MRERLEKALLRLICIGIGEIGFVEFLVLSSLRPCFLSNPNASTLFVAFYALDVFRHQIKLIPAFSGLSIQPLFIGLVQ